MAYHMHDPFDEDDSFDNEPFQAVYQCYSTIFLSDRDRARTDIENGGKILLPESALEQLVHQVTNNIRSLKRISFFCFSLDWNNVISIEKC